MAISKVDIWNSAGTILGGPDKGLVQSDTDETDFAEWCQSQWELTVDFCLENLGCTEAKAYASCSETGDSVEMSDWDYAYDLPNDILFIIDMTDEDGRDLYYEYEINGDYLFSDNDECYIRYVKRLNYDDVSKWGAAVKEFIAARLAWKAAPKFAPKMVQVAHLRYVQARSEAEAASGKRIYVEPMTEWTTIY